MFLVSRLQSFIATTTCVTSASSFQTCHSFKALLLSRPPSLVTTSTFVATSRCCRDIIPLVSAQSSAAYLVIPVASCIKFPSIFLMSRPHNGTVHTQKCNINQPVASISVLPFDCTFTPPIAAFFYFFFFFLSLFLLITNW